MARREARGGFRPWRWLRRAWRGLRSGPFGLVVLRIGLVLAALGLGALLFVAAGLVPVAASAGHWPITRTLLHFAMARSVQTHALGVERPSPGQSLETQARVLKGAGHYASGCLPCHGAPGQPRAAVMRHAVPEPPYLPPKIDEWNDRQLFWIVKHGIKYTAMPAWPSQRRDDEAWAMVAFLRRLPRLDADGFRRLAYGDGGALLVDNPEPARGLDRAGRLALRLADCARCHGRDGRGRGTGAFPALAGQSEAYLLASLRAFARGERHSGVMEPVAMALGADEMRALAAHYARLPAAPAVDDTPPPAAAEVAPHSRAPADEGRAPASVERGGRLARHGDAALRIPSCVECHGPGRQARNPAYPRLAGQHPDYLALQLHVFKQGRRGGTAYAHIMGTIADSLDDDAIRDIAAWYGSLPPEPAAAAPDDAAD